MIKWFKKHCKKLIIASSILTACICGLFGFTKSYAYDIDNNGNLVGNNLNVFGSSSISSYSTTVNSNLSYTKVNDNTFNVNFNNFTNSSLNVIIECPNFLINSYFDVNINYVVLIDSSNLTTNNSNSLNVGIKANNQFSSATSVLASINNLYNVNNGTTLCFAFPYKYSYTGTGASYFGYNLRGNIGSSTTLNGYLSIKIFAFINIQKDYFISSNQTFYPYSSIEQLQQDYDNLMEQYNNYVANHSYTNTQYNDLVSSNTLLQQQLSTLQLQYDTYVATHTHTDTEYNNLLDGYDDLLDTQRELESDYNELQIAYNTMKVNYDTLNNAINYGIFAYIDGYNYGQVLEAGVFFYGNYNNSTYYIMPPSGSDYIWSFNDLIEEGLLESGGILRIDKITERSDYNSNVNYSCQIRLNHMPITSFYLDIQNMNGAYIQVRDYSSTQRTVSFTTNSIDHTFTYQNIYSVDSQFNNEISDIIISPQFTSSSILGQAIGATASIQSYNNGYNDGVNFMSYYKNEYDTLSREYESARRDIATLRELNESLNEQISSNLGWKSLFFAMADTPLKTVSNVLGFELFGVNLFTTFIGMVTVLGIVFLLKKLI